MVIKLKYKICTIVFIVLGVFVLRLSMIKDKVSDFEFVYEQVEQVTHKVYYYDSTKLVYIDIVFDNNVSVVELFDLLSNQSNSIKEDYDTKIITSTKLLSYEVVNEELHINLSDDFLRYNEEECFLIYNQLRNTFSNLGYTSLKIKVDDNYLEFIGYINITNGIELYNI